MNKWDMGWKAHKAKQEGKEPIVIALADVLIAFLFVCVWLFLTSFLGN